MNHQTISKGGDAMPCGEASSPLTALIVAGGSGLRAGGGVPKQFHDLCGKMVFMHAVEAFLAVDGSTRIIIVTHPDYAETVRQQLEALALRRPVCYDIVAGGASRWESVRNGLHAVGAGCRYVAVHDAARPLVDARIISDGWECAREHRAAVACVPVTDSLRMKEDTGATHAVDRSMYLAVQTPQVFDIALLREAYSHPCRDTFTDDASVVEAAGHDVEVFAGDPANIKITSPADFAVAAAILAQRNNIDRL